MEKINERQEKAFLANAYSMMGQCQGMVGKMKALAQHFESFTTHMWICIHIFRIFICTYVDGDTCETCFHCQSSLSPGSLMGCALVADFLPGRIEVGQ